MYGFIIYINFFLFLFVLTSAEREQCQINVFTALYLLITVRFLYFPLLVLLRLVISCGWHFEFSDRFAVLRRHLLLIASTRGEGLVKIWKWFADLKTIHWTIQILTEWKRHRETAMGKWKEVRAVQKVPYTRILTPRDTTLFGRKGLVDKTLFNTRFYSLFVFSAIFLI